MTAFLRRYYAGGGTTTSLASSMSASDTSFTVNSATGWPGSPGSDFIVVVDRATSSEEKILCSSNSGATVTVATRGYDGTSATTHNASATVSLCGGAIDFDESNQLTNLMGNGAEGSLFYGKGTGALPAKLAVGTAGQLLGNNGTDPTWLTALAEGSLFYGKGTTTAPAALTIGASGDILTSNGTDPAWSTSVSPPNVALSVQSGNISSNVTLTAGTGVKIFDTASLVPGTWLVTMCATVDIAGGGGQIELTAAEDSATATLTGTLSAQVSTGAAAAAQQAVCSFVAVVTVAGTLEFKGYTNGVNNGTALSATIGSAGYANATGYTAIRIA